MLVLSDADPELRSASVPAVDGRSVRLFAGVPIVSAAGRILGTLAVVDTVRRRLTDAEERGLGHLTAQLREDLELRRRLRYAETSERWLRTIFDTSLNAVITMNADGRVADWSAQAERTFGWAREEIVGRRLSEAIVPERYREAHERGLERFRATREGPVLGQVIEISALHRDGRELPVELVISPALRFGDTDRFVAFVRDITERHRMAGLQGMQSAVTRVLADAADMDDATQRILSAIAVNLGCVMGQLWLVDDRAGGLRWHNAWYDDSVDLSEFCRASQAMAFAPGVGLPGRVWEACAPCTLADVVTDGNFPRARSAAQVGLHGALGFPIMNQGEVTGVMEFFARVELGLQADILEIMADIGSQIGQFARRKRAETDLQTTLARLAETAATDPLTRLKNRREFERMLAAASGEPYAILAIDVDNLKPINDEFGHEAGDTVLQAVGSALSSLTRGGDVVARIGGDEFAIVLSRVPDRDVAQLAERIRLAMHGISLPQGRARVTIGWAAGPAGADPHAVWRTADLHLYQAKRRGRDRVSGAGYSGGSPIVQGPDWGEILTTVLSERVVQMVFQPIVRLADRRIVGVEALARPLGHGPDASVEGLFVAAQRLGRTRDLDWLCRRAAIAAGEALPRGLPLFVNVSVGALLDPVHGADQMLLVLDRHRRSASEVVLEISEREQVGDMARLTTVLADYREHGFRFAIDDVGDGQTSLGVLAAAQPEFIKLARSLVTTGDQAGSASAIRAAVTFARNTGAQVVDEGVEDEVVAGRIAEFGVELGQGHGLGRPAPAETYVGRIETATA
jgi:diguanylate cyclase (GGDEF)-like protein/PAS domain S-box-containing protein